MEKKKKGLRILARVLAIVTALVCTLCMVVPSYAEETSVNLAQEQEATLNSMVGEGTFYASDYVVDLDYREVQTYALFDSTAFSVFGAWPSEPEGLLVFTQSGYMYASVFDADGQEVAQIGINFQSIQISQPISAGYQSRILFRDTVTNRYASIGATLSADGMVSFRFIDATGTTTYYMNSGYSFKGFCVQWDATPETGVFYYYANKIYNPSFLLSLNVGGGSDEEAYNQGYQVGVQAGYDVGYDAGIVEGWDAGHTEGYTNGLDQGYRDGYDDGMTQMSLIDLITEIIRAPMTLIESTLNFNIFGINLSNAVKALVTMALLAVVVTIVWKAVK